MPHCSAMAARKRYHGRMAKPWNPQHVVNRALLRAAETGRARLLEDALRDGADNLDQALCQACAAGQLEAVNALLRAGATPEGLPAAPATPLAFAVSNDRLDVAATLLSRLAPEAIHAQAWSASVLHNACLNANLDMVRLLIAHGASLDRLSPDGYTPLMFAAMRRDEALGVTLLLLDALDPSCLGSASPSGETAAMLARECGNWEAAEAIENAWSRWLEAGQLRQASGGGAVSKARKAL